MVTGRCGHDARRDGAASPAAKRITTHQSTYQSHEEPMSKARTPFNLDDEGEPLTCFFCDVAIPRARLEMDHMPVPDRCGGESLVPACVVCHDLKDRISLVNLPIEFMADFMRDFQKLSRNGRIIMAKVYAVACELQHKLTDTPLRKKHRPKAPATLVPEPILAAHAVN
jgi:hypothetical protein